jgi:hypothetical protein
MPPETTTDTATGATPGAGATPAQAGSAGANAGATPAAAAGTKPAAADDSATDDSTLGESGKAVLREARRAAKEADDRAKAAEAELQQLREAGQSDQDKAITQARREGAAERDAHWKARIRAAEVRGALRGGGIVDDEALELALGARQFRDLKVDSETGSIDGLPEAVESFRKTAPWAFKATTGSQTPAQGGSVGRRRGRQQDQGTGIAHRSARGPLQPTEPTLTSRQAWAGQ